MELSELDCNFLQLENPNQKPSETWTLCKNWTLTEYFIQHLLLHI